MTDMLRMPSVEEEGRTLVERLGGRWTANGGVCRCPAHEDRTPSLSIRAGRTRLLLHCFAGCAARDVLRALERARLLEPGARQPADGTAPSSEHRLHAAALRIWRDARSIPGTAADAYLAARAIRTSSAQLRFHPRTPRGAVPLTQYRPAMIAAVRDDAGLVAIHRTFLRPSGDRGADIPAARCGLGRFGAGAVRLGAAGPALGLAEGIETALSASTLFGIPCWATLGTERFRLVSLPPAVDRLLLFLDHDAGGRRAEALARTAFGDRLCIEAHYPPRQGDDWNDVLRSTRIPASRG